MKRWVDVHSSHGGATVIDGSVPVTAVDKMVNQPSTKHHSIMTKLKQDFSRSEAHRRATATVKRTRRRCYRSRGRKATSGVPRQNQAPRLSELGSQGVGGARTGFAETVKALQRRRKHDGAATVATGKTEEEKEENGDCVGA